jgi:hypothetical protein
MATDVRIGERYWLTAKGCEAAGGHKVHDDGACRTCVVCGTNVDEDGAR